MVVAKGNVMYQCKVFYIGCSDPDESKKGVEAIQKPLRERYRGNVADVEGYDVTITITPNVVQIVYANNAQPTQTLPISSLSICAAVRCVEGATDPSNMKFIPVHSVITNDEPDSEHPAIFATVMKSDNDESGQLMCHSFICNSTRDALHLVNAVQTAHTAMRRGYNATGAMKFFIDQSTEFDRTLRIAQDGRKADTRKIYMYQEDYDTRQFNTDTKTYVTTIGDTDKRQFSRVSRIYNDANIVTDNQEGTTYYIKAGEVRAPTPPSAQHSETVLVKSSVEHIKAPTPPPQQTIYVDKPIVRPAPPVDIPPPKIIERPVYIDPPVPPKIDPQVIYVDKPMFKEMQWPEPPKPRVIEKPVYIEPPPPPKQEPQEIIVDRPILKEWPEPPAQPPPIIKENPVYLDPPKWPEQKPQVIIVDRPIIKEPSPAPPPPAPIIEEREVYIDPPEYPKQQPHRIVIEKPVFNEPKEAPRPPTPIIETKNVYIEPPPYPEQEPQRIVIEKPIIQDPGPPPPAPKPIIIEKPVPVELPKYPPQEPQRIIVEKPVMRDPGPPPPPPKPIIIEKIVYIDPPPWPKIEPQRIIVEKPVFRPRPPPPIPKPVIIEKPVYVDAPAPPPIEPQTIVVEKPQPREVLVERPAFRTTYGLSETRRYPSAYGYNYQYRPTNVRGSYIVRSMSPPRGLRRYAWSDAGDERDRVYSGGYRLYGQPRDFRERQFMNERGFSRRINEEMRYSHGPRSYTFGSAYRMNRRDSVSS